MYYVVFILFNIFQIEYTLVLLSFIFLLSLYFFNMNVRYKTSKLVISTFILNSYDLCTNNFRSHPMKNIAGMINYRVSDLSIYQTNTNLILHYFIRKNRVFNKGRYSRNRQTCKMAFYLALSIHSIAVTGLFMWYYNLLIKFTYMWYVFIL